MVVEKVLMTKLTRHYHHFQKFRQIYQRSIQMLVRLVDRRTAGENHLDDLEIVRPEFEAGVDETM